MEAAETITFCNISIIILSENHGGLMNTQSDAHWMTTFKSSLRTPDRIR